jgi:hypothetical protein
MGAPVCGAHATAMVNGNAVHALGCARAGVSSMPRPIAVRHAQRRDDRRTRCGRRRRGYAAPLQRAWESLTPLQTASPSGPPRLRRRPGEAVTRFTECAEILRATTMSNEAVISCPVLGSTTSAVIAEVALMEVTVHLLDLLVDVPDPTAAIEVLAGRAIQRSLCRRSGDDRSPLTAN